MTAVAPSILSTGVESWGLTRMESAVVRALSDGATNREIGDRLFISSRTVEVHLTRVFRKAGVRCRTQLVAQMFQR